MPFSGWLDWLRTVGLLGILVAGELHVTYDGQKTTVLKRGSYAYGPARLRHKAVCVSTSPCVLFIAFESPLDAVPVENAVSQLQPGKPLLTPDPWEPAH